MKDYLLILVNGKYTLSLKTLKELNTVNLSLDHTDKRNNALSISKAANDSNLISGKLTKFTQEHISVVTPDSQYNPYYDLY